MSPMTSTYSLAGHDVNRVGYGTMQLPGPGVFGPPKDRDQALAVLRRARELGVDHFDTSAYYGPWVSNDLLREAAPVRRDRVHAVLPAGLRQGHRQRGRDLDRIATGRHARAGRARLAARPRAEPARDRGDVAPLPPRGERRGRRRRPHTGGRRRARRHLTS